MSPTTRDAKSRRLLHQGKKPAAFYRVWSVADDLRILEGLAAYTAKHRAPPLRCQLHAALAGCALDKPKFTVSEIYEKVRRLKYRYFYRRSAGRVAPGGDEPRKYELAKAIWGKEMESGLVQPEVVKKEGGTSANAAPDMRVRRGFEEMRCLYPNLSAVVERIVRGEDRDLMGPVLKRAFEFMDDDEADEWDAKVKKQRVLEIKMTKGRTTMRNKVVDALLKSME